MGQNWPYRHGDENGKVNNGNKPDKGTGASPRGRGYHPGRSCQREAVTVAVFAGLAAKMTLVAVRMLRTRAKVARW